MFQTGGYLSLNLFQTGGYFGLILFKTGGYCFLDSNTIHFIRRVTLAFVIGHGGVFGETALNFKNVLYIWGWTKLVILDSDKVWK